MTTDVTLADALSEERIAEFTRQVGSLPSGSEYRNRVQNDLWEQFVPEGLTDRQKVEYTQLREEARDLFGTLGGPNGSSPEVPWWFLRFEWKVLGAGPDPMTLDGETMSSFGDFSQDIRLQKPTYRSYPDEENQITVAEALDALKSISETIDLTVGQTVQDDSTTGMALPDEIFETGDRQILTTDSFKSWLADVVALFPGRHEVSTALIMCNSNVPLESASGFLEERTIERLRDVDLITRRNGTNYVYNEEQTKAFIRIMKFDGEFDLLIDTGSDLPGIKYDFYRVWVSGATPSNNITKFLNKLDDKNAGMNEKDIGAFGRVACNVPLRIGSRNRLCFSTETGRISPDRGDILDLLRKEGFVSDGS